MGDAVQSKINMAFAERISALEEHHGYSRREIQALKELQTNLDLRLDNLSESVRGIRNALYVLAAAVASNIPAVADVLSPIFKVLIP